MKLSKYILCIIGIAYVRESYSQIRKAVYPQPTLQIDEQLRSCCNVIDNSTELIDCINAAVESKNRDITEVFTSNGGPNLQIGLVSYATENIRNYTAYAFAVNAIYAHHNNYILKLLDPTTSDYDSSDSRWNKIKILEESIHPGNGWGRNLDYVLWLDADLIFLDMSMRLEKIAVMHPKAHILVSAEHAGSTTLINSGTILVRNTNWSRQFLSDWWKYENRTLYSDQEQFDLLYKSILLSEEGGGNTVTQRPDGDKDSEKVTGLRSKVVVLEPDGLNSDPPAMTQQKEYNQVLHLMGEQMPFRIKVFKSAYSEICRHLSLTSSTAANTGTSASNKGLSKSNKNIALKNQLTVSRENLLKWTLETYSIESKTLLDAYKLTAHLGIHGVSATRELSNSIHHFAHALEYHNPQLSEEVQNKNVVLANNLRGTVYQLMLTNLNAQRTIYLNKVKELHGKNTQNVYPYPPDWPELVKTTATAGQHLITLGSISDRKRLIDELMSLMDEMLQTSNHLQHNAIQHMIAYMYLQKGMLYLHQDNYMLETAYKHLKHSLQISETLAEISGEHILVSPLTVCANVLSTMNKHNEAEAMYLKAIKLSELHLGPMHESLGTLLVNYGISMVQMGQFKKARGNLQRAIDIIERNDPKHEKRGNISYIRGKEYLKLANEKKRG